MTTPARRVAVALVGAVALAAPFAAKADEAFPQRAIRMVTMAPAGSGADAILRAVAMGMRDDLGQPVIVDNRPGADGIVAAQHFVGQRADGYTIMGTMHTQLVANPGLYAKLPYDVERDFVPLSIVSRNPVVLVVHPSVRARTLRELVDESRSRADGIDVGTGSITFQVQAATITETTGLVLRPIPYVGMMATVLGVLGGQVGAALADVSTVVDAIQAGRLRAIAIGAPSRIAALPDVPTFGESGYPSLDEPLWIAMVALAGTPPAISERLRRSLLQSLASPIVRDKLAAIAAAPSPGTADELAETARRERAAFAAEVAKLGIPKK